jgi:hypothetical protein
MDLKVSWQIDNSLLKENENPIKITSALIYQETKRYKGRGIEENEIFNGKVSPSESGFIQVSASFDFAGDQDSLLHIYLYSDRGDSIHAYFSSPVNGFKSINLDSGGTVKDADRWIGGNTYGEVTF